MTNCVYCTYIKCARCFSCSSGSPKVLLPPILMSSNSNTWLSTRCHVKRLGSSPIQTSNSNASEDLSKWLAVAHNSQTVDNLSQGNELIFIASSGKV